MAKSMPLTEKYSITDDTVELFLTGYLGRTAGGDHSISFEERLNGKVVSKGKALYWRNNSPVDIIVDENGRILSQHKLSPTGEWLTGPGNKVDTNGYGREK